MGNESPSLNDHQLFRTYRPQQWLKQTLDNNGQLWRNKYTHQLVKLYPLQTIPSIQDLNRYQLRSTHQYLVKVFNIASQQYASVCNSNQNGLLLVEHIPLKLKDVDFLDLQECLTVLHSSYRGFHTIQSLFQLVQPQEELIGFNEQGKTKVWLNRQLNINYTPKQLKPSELNQFKRVIRILEMVHKKIPANRQFYNLRQQILQHSVNYFEASIIIEEFAFREQLSLKRYIRTDLLTRPSNRPEGMRRKTTISTVIPIQRQNVTPIRRSQIILNQNQLQKITSQSRLTPVKTTYIVRNQPVRVDEQINLSRLTAIGSSPTLMGCKSIPRITFNKNTDAFGSPKLPVSMKQNIVFYSPKIQQRVTQFSPVLPLEQPKLLTMESPKQVLEQKEKNDAKNNIKEVKTQNQTNKIELKNKIIEECKQDIKCESSQTSSKVEGSPVTKLRFAQKKHSIIDQCQKYLQKSIHGSPQQQVYEKLQVLQSPSGQEVHQSGMFRQIGETQGRDDTYFIKDEIKQQEANNKQIVEKVQTQTKQIPINFSSFAVEKVAYVENMSFAPNPTQNNVINENRQGTTKSLDLQQKEQEHVSQAKSQHSSSHSRIEDPSKKNFRLIESEQRVIYHNHTSIINEESLNQSPSAVPTNRFSYELQQQFSAICKQQKPFYQAYTPVQSKFDIVIKKDNAIDKEREATERSNGISAYGIIEQDRSGDKNKYKRVLPSDEFRIYRISSEYQTKTKKNFDTSRQVRPQQKIMKIPNINEGPEQDFLDINNLQKTLQMKCSKKVHKKSDEFDVSKLEQKLLKFSSSRGQIGSQNQKRQIRQTQDKTKDLQKKSSLGAQRKQDKKYSNYQIYYEQNVVLSNDYPSTQRYKTYNNQYEGNTQQYDVTSRTNNKYNLNSNNYSNLAQQNINSPSYLGYELTSDIYDKYGTTSYNKYTDTLLQYSKIKKQPDDLLEERYQKYVKEGRKKPSLSKQKSLDNIYKKYQIPERTQAQRGKRISYDRLRQFLWN